MTDPHAYPFAFIVHPLSIADVARKYKLARYAPDAWVEYLLRYMKPQVVSEITGVRSATGATTTGWFIGCPLTAKQLVEGDPRKNTEMIVRCGQVAQEAGAEIVGLGAFTSIVGDAGITIAEELEIGVTTGNSYTVATAVEGALRAAEAVGLQVPRTRVAILGATGSIGRIAAKLVAPQVASLALFGRREDALQELVAELPAGTAAEAHTEVNGALGGADIIIAVTSALEALVEPEMLKPGCVVCDVARPRDVSVRVAQCRPDVLVIEGGAVAIPGEVEFNFNFGFPPRTAYACMAETMILALEGKVGDYSLGRDLRQEQVEEMATLARRHGFELAGFRSFERQVDAEDIARVRAVNLG